MTATDGRRVEEGESRRRYVEDMRENQLPLGFGTTRWREWGAPEGAPLLLLHGLTASGAAWAATAAELGDFRVLAPDARGHGGSHRPGRYSFAAMATDLGEFMDELGLERAAVVGHSMGAVAAARLAQWHPERITALGLVEMPPPSRIRRPVPERPSGDLDYDWQARIQILDELDTDAAGHTPYWSRILAPTLIAGGGPESPFSQEAMEQLAATLPRAEFCTVEVGHSIPAQAPEELAELIRRLLDRA